MRERLKSSEDNSKNINTIIETMRSNENTHKTEVKETKELLDLTMKKVKVLEKKNENHIGEVEMAKKEAEMLKLKLQEKDVELRDMRNSLEHGKYAQHIKHLKDELDICVKERNSEKRVREQLEINLDKLNTSLKVEFIHFIVYVTESIL